MLGADRLQYLVEHKSRLDTRTKVINESWAVIDGALVIYDPDDPPAWLPHNWERDENGDTRPEVLKRMDEQADQRASDMADLRAKAGLS